jgi:hypothetical protein
MKIISFHPEELQILYNVVTQGYRFSIKWEGDKLIVDQSDEGEFQQYHKEITPSHEEWEEFWFMMDEIEIWDWYSEYSVQCLHEDDWEVSIKYQDQLVESRGKSSYPGTFREFMKAVEELTGVIVDYFHLD